jgi:quercetin dioxygenase-like cupin family protein
LTIRSAKDSSVALDDPKRSVTSREGKTMRRLVFRGFIALPFAAVTLGASPATAPVVEQVKPVFEHVLPNVPGKSMVAVVVTYPPGAKSAAHRHAPSAFIYAHVLSGAIRSRVDNQSAKVYAVGEGFYESPGAHHWISENASSTEPASLLAVFVVDSKDKVLTTPDATEVRGK